MDKSARSAQRKRASDPSCSNSKEDDTPPRKESKGPVTSSEAPVKAQRGNFIRDTIPGELLTGFFRFLEVEDKGPAARVCRRWKDFVNHPSLWRDINAQLHLSKLPDNAFQDLKGVQIKKVTVVDRCQPDELQKLVTTLLNVEVLSVKKGLSSNQQLESIFSSDSLRRLKCLHLGCKNLTSTSISSALERLDGVQHFEFLDFCPSNFFSFLSVLKKARHLTVIFKSQGQTDVPQGSQPMPSMTELVLRKVSFNESVLLYLKQAFPNLKKLDVELDDSVTVAGIQHVAGMAQLKRLHLHAKKCPAEWMHCLKDGLTQLNTLELDAKVPNPEDLMTLTDIPTLKDLTLSNGILTENFLQSCKKLNRFALNFCEPVQFPEAPVLLPNLKEVCLELSTGLRDGHIQVLCQDLPSLEKLTLKSTFCLSNDSLKYLAEVPTLKNLVLSCNNLSIDGNGLQYLRMGNAPLQELSLLHLTKVGDPDIKVLKGLKSLQRLRVFGCNVYDEALIHCVMELPALQVLESDMSQESKRQLRRMRPGLTVRILSPEEV